MLARAGARKARGAISGLAAAGALPQSDPYGRGLGGSGSQSHAAAAAASGQHAACCSAAADLAPSERLK